MILSYKKATIENIALLTQSRINVLKAANHLDQTADMSIVEKESYHYYKQALSDNSHTAYLIFDKDRLVGTGGISYFTVMPTYHNPSGKKAYIMNMYTDPDYRRKGIAYHTLDILIADARVKGITHITLEATENGRPLYEKYGFVMMNHEMRYSPTFG